MNLIRGHDISNDLAFPSDLKLSADIHALLFLETRTLIMEEEIDYYSLKSIHLIC